MVPLPTELLIIILDIAAAQLIVDGRRVGSRPSPQLDPASDFLIRAATTHSTWKEIALDLLMQYIIVTSDNFDRWREVVKERGCRMKINSLRVRGVLAEERLDEVLYGLTSVSKVELIDCIVKRFECLYEERGTRSYFSISPHARCSLTP